MGIKLITTSKWQGTRQEHDISDFGYNDSEAKELLESFKDGSISKKEMQEFEAKAQEDHGLEWWIEEE